MDDNIDPNTARRSFGAYMEHVYDIPTEWQPNKWYDIIINLGQIRGVFDFSFEYLINCNKYLH